jgi:hypothetical protein
MPAAAKTVKIRVAPNTIITLDDGTIARAGAVVTVPAQHAKTFIDSGLATKES